MPLRLSPQSIGRFFRSSSREESVHGHRIVGVDDGSGEQRQSVDGQNYAGVFRCQERAACGGILEAVEYRTLD